MAKKKLSNKKATTSKNKGGRPKGTAKPPRSSGDWVPVFIKQLAVNGNVRNACEKSGVARQTAYDRKDKDPEFARAWQEAVEMACDTLEEAAFNRAKNYSDTLMIFLLKSHRPDKYREKRETKVDLKADVTMKDSPQSVEAQRQYILGVLSNLEKMIEDEDDDSETEKDGDSTAASNDQEPQS